MMRLFEQLVALRPLRQPRCVAARLRRAILAFALMSAVLSGVYSGNQHYDRF